ncbi:MAG: hypothetical protein AB7D24_11400 [Sphaerochaeta sp.]|uniref:hypothetical protein n=1 Tax=Sphaerochaeta sp. TaxID=1972642 RepID=UPI003D12437A
MIKPIDWKNGVLFSGMPKKTASLPFGHTALVCPIVSGGEIIHYIWRIKQSTCIIKEGQEPTEKLAMLRCESAWEELVKDALVSEIAEPMMSKVRNETAKIYAQFLAEGRGKR